MLPLLRPGQHVLVCPAGDWGDPGRGEIVLMSAGGRRRVVHRLVRVEKRRSLLVTQGDNSSREDKPWPVEHLAGVVVAAEGGGGDWLCPRPIVGRMMIEGQRLGLARWMRGALRILGAMAWKRAARGRWLAFDCGEVVHLFDSISGDARVLNATAAVIWREAGLGRGADDIVRRLQRLYKGEAGEKLRGDVESALSEFERQGMIRRDA